MYVYICILIKRINMYLSRWSSVVKESSVVSVKKKEENIGKLTNRAQ
jgi:hypothetical protein